MNSVYERGYLLDGFYDKKIVNFSIRRYIYNNYVALSMLIVSLIHILLFLNNNDFLIRELIFFKITDGKFMRVCNLSVGLCVGALSNFFINHRYFTKQPHKFHCLNFLFCLDENEMQDIYHLNEKNAKDQVFYHRNFIKFIGIWDQVFGVTYALFIAFLSFDHFIRITFGLVFILKLALSLSLYFSIHTSAKRVCLLAFEVFFSSLYLSKSLESLRVKTECCVRMTLNNDWSDWIRDQKINQKLKNSVKSYNLIIILQRKINLHCSKTMHFLLFILLFTGIFRPIRSRMILLIRTCLVLYPTLILDNTENFLLVIFFALNYAVLIGGCLFPLVYFNTKFIYSVSF